jgi:hypothetical protein
MESMEGMKITPGRRSNLLLTVQQASHVNSPQNASGTVVAISVMEIDFGIASRKGAKRYTCAGTRRL